MPTTQPFTTNNPATGQESVPSANVILQPPVPNATDTNALFVGSTDPNAIIADYKIRNRYLKDGHTFMLGITSPTGFQTNPQSPGYNRAAFVQLAAPTLLWVCDWTASKSKSPPEIPAPVQANGNWILLHIAPETSAVGLSADGVTPLYRISGTWIYGHVACPLNVLTDAVAYGKPPWLGVGPDKLNVPPNTIL